MAKLDEANIHQALPSLIRAGKIRRVCRWGNDYPRYGDLLDRQMSPALDQVAHALIRKYNWRIQTSGDAALNLLGLSIQVPERWIYLSGGPGREYGIGNHSLSFKKSALNDVGLNSGEWPGGAGPECAGSGTCGPEGGRAYPPAAGVKCV